MAKFKHHVFVCENERDPSDPRGSCGRRGATEIREALKKECNQRGMKGLVRVNKAGCLDQCHVGVAVVVYPEQTWYGGVRIEDVPRIAESIQNGSVVHPLVVPDSHLTGTHGSQSNQGNTPGGF